MSKRVPIFLISVLATVLFFSAYAPSFAGDNVEDLKKQIEALQKRVDELESAQARQNQGQGNAWGALPPQQNQGWDPFDEMRRMQEDMDRMLQNSSGPAGSPQGGVFSNSMSFDTNIDMKETSDGYEITLDMQGLDKDKVDININEHSITVKGESSRQDKEESTGSVFSSSSYGSFMKTIPLPVDADTSKVTSEKEGENLVIRIPKKLS